MKTENVVEENRVFSFFKRKVQGILRC